jgi:hypothetical protein
VGPIAHDRALMALREGKHQFPHALEVTADAKRKLAEILDRLRIDRCAILAIKIFCSGPRRLADSLAINPMELF